MSVKKWQQLAEEKSKLDKQTEEIHQKFRMNEINKEFGQLSGEELFRPIKKGLMKKAAPLRKKKKRSRKFLITQWMNLTKLTRLVMNSDRIHQLQHHHHQQHPQQPQHL